MSRGPYRLSALLGLPENLGDVLDLGEQGVGDGRVGAALGASGARELGGVVEQLVQLRVLLADGLDRLGLDPGLCRVVDAARKVAVRERGGLWREAACEEPHGVLLSGAGSRVGSTDHGF